MHVRRGSMLPRHAHTPVLADVPTPADLAAIEAEMPLIEAEMVLLSAEILLITADPEPTALDWHRMRRAEALVMRELVKLHTSRPAERSATRRPQAA